MHGGDGRQNFGGYFEERKVGEQSEANENERKQRKRESEETEMRNFWECVLIAMLFFAATTALLHVDEQASRRCGYEEAFSAKKVEIFQHMH